MAATTQPTELEAQVRSLWQAYERGGVKAMHEIAGPDVDWIPWSAGGAVLRGQRELGEWYERRPAQTMRAAVHGFETHGSCVLAYGSLRIHRDGGFVDVQPSWVYSFRGGLLIRAEAFMSREGALAAIREFNAED